MEVDVAVVYVACDGVLSDINYADGKGESFMQHKESLINYDTGTWLSSLFYYFSCKYIDHVVLQHIENISSKRAGSWQ